MEEDSINTSKSQKETKNEGNYERETKKTCGININF